MTNPLNRRQLRAMLSSFLRRNEPLSNEDINTLAPSAFASEPWVATSARYAFVPTVNVIEGMRSAGFLPYSAQQSGTRVPGKAFFTKHMLRFRSINPTESALAIGDTKIETIMVNSHDGTSCYELYLGAFECACLNGLFVARTLVESVKIRHTGNIVSEVVEATRNLITKAPLVESTINAWKNTMLTDREALILAESAFALRFEQGEVTLTPDRLLTPNRASDNTNSLWHIFNRIQENVIKGGLRTRTPERTNEQGDYVPSRRMRTRAVSGIDQSAKLNRELWALAAKMAELKGGK